jgi:hypothetical protein
MLDEQDRCSGFGTDALQQRIEGRRFPRIQAGGWFVQAKQLGASAHGTGNLETPLGAVGQIACRIVGAVDQIGLF